MFWRGVRAGSSERDTSRGPASVHSVSVTWLAPRGTAWRLALSRSPARRSASAAGTRAASSASFSSARPRAGQGGAQRLAQPAARLGEVALRLERRVAPLHRQRPREGSAGHRLEARGAALRGRRGRRRRPGEAGREAAAWRDAAPGHGADQAVGADQEQVALAPGELGHQLERSGGALEAERHHAVAGLERQGLEPRALQRVAQRRLPGQRVVGLRGARRDQVEPRQLRLGAEQEQRAPAAPVQLQREGALGVDADRVDARAAQRLQLRHHQLQLHRRQRHAAPKKAAAARRRPRHHSAAESVATSSSWRSSSSQPSSRPSSWQP